MKRLAAPGAIICPVERRAHQTETPARQRERIGRAPRPRLRIAFVSEWPAVVGDRDDQLDALDVDPKPKRARGRTPVQDGVGGDLAHDELQIVDDLAGQAQVLQSPRHGAAKPGSVSEGSRPFGLEDVHAVRPLLCKPRAGRPLRRAQFAASAISQANGCELAPRPN